MADNILTLKGITKIFNQGTQDEKRALDDFSLEVPDSDFITIIGSNGAGKTTTINMLTGLARPDSGAIRIGGIDCTGNPRADRKSNDVPWHALTRLD